MSLQTRLSSRAFLHRASIDLSERLSNSSSAQSAFGESGAWGHGQGSLRRAGSAAGSLRSLGGSARSFGSSVRSLGGSARSTVGGLSGGKREEDKGAAAAVADADAAAAASDADDRPTGRTMLGGDFPDRSSIAEPREGVRRRSAGVADSSLTASDEDLPLPEDPDEPLSPWIAPGLGASRASPRRAAPHLDAGALDVSLPSLSLPSRMGAPSLPFILERVSRENSTVSNQRQTPKGPSRETRGVETGEAASPAGKRGGDEDGESDGNRHGTGNGTGTGRGAESANGDEDAARSRARCIEMVGAASGATAPGQGRGAGLFPSSSSHSSPSKDLVPPVGPKRSSDELSRRELPTWRSSASLHAPSQRPSSPGRPPPPSAALSTQPTLLPTATGALADAVALSSSGSGLVAASSSSSEECSSEDVVPRALRRALIRKAIVEDGYNVVITGHSLGAAVACLLALQLRPRIPRAECWCFSPPGGLVSWNLACATRRFCTSVVAGKDAITRLSFANAKRAVDEVVLALARCSDPKLSVAFGLATGLSRAGRRELPLDRISDEAVERLARYHAISARAPKALLAEMYPPGNIVFLRPFKVRAGDADLDRAPWNEHASRTPKAAGRMGGGGGRGDAGGDCGRCVATEANVESDLESGVPPPRGLGALGSRLPSFVPSDASTDALVGRLPGGRSTSAATLLDGTSAVRLPLPLPPSDEAEEDLSSMRSHPGAFSALLVSLFVRFAHWCHGLFAPTSRGPTQFDALLRTYRDRLGRARAKSKVASGTAGTAASRPASRAASAAVTAAQEAGGKLAPAKDGLAVASPRAPWWCLRRWLGRTAPVPASPTCNDTSPRPLPPPPPARSLFSTTVAASPSSSTSSASDASAPQAATRTLWDAVWVDATVLIGEGIVIAPSMMACHRMVTVARAIADAFANRKGGDVEASRDAIEAAHRVGDIAETLGGGGADDRPEGFAAMLIPAAAKSFGDD